MTKRTKAKGFTLTELIICMGIMLLVVYMSMSPHIGDVTAKQEAERLNVWLARIIQQAIRMKRGFTMYVMEPSIKILWWNGASSEWGSPFKATSGCKLVNTSSKGDFSFSVDKGFGSKNGTIEVTGQDGSKHYLVLSKTGRIRLSDEKPYQ
ncbi:MAG: type II secretion system protein [Synergistaceae bacterium]|nr:type II secretion system protein [Synergistaceae bacterium]